LREYFHVLCCTWPIHGPCGGDMATSGLLTPNASEGVWFFEEVLGTERDAGGGAWAYVRGLADNEGDSIELTASRGLRWTDGDVGREPADRFEVERARTHWSLVRGATVASLPVAAVGGSACRGVAREPRCQ
jgi:hypothetical protein